MMKSRAERIAATMEKIADLKGKWTTLKNRISRLEQTLKTLLKHSETERDALILTDAKNRLQADPKEVETLRKRLDEQALTDEQRALFNLPPKNGGDAERHAPNSATETMSNTPRSTANNGDGASAGTADPDAAEADTPDSTANAAPDESRSHANDVDAAPAEQRSAQAAAANQPAPHNQDPRATAKQLDYIKALIAQRPEKEVRTLRKKLNEQALTDEQRHCSTSPPRMGAMPSAMRRIRRPKPRATRLGRPPTTATVPLRALRTPTPPKPTLRTRRQTPLPTSLGPTQTTSTPRRPSRDRRRPRRRINPHLTTRTQGPPQSSLITSRP